jgi:hypothetical protein
MAYSACWRSHTSELDLALARRLSSCGRRRSPAARTLTNCTCGEGAAALLAVAKAVGEGGTLYSSPTRWRWRWHMQPAQPPTRSCLIRIWMASRLCPLSCVAGAHRYKIKNLMKAWQGSTKGRRHCCKKIRCNYPIFRVSVHVSSDSLRVNMCEHELTRVVCGAPPTGPGARPSRLQRAAHRSHETRHTRT